MMIKRANMAIPVLLWTLTATALLLWPAGAAAGEESRHTKNLWAPLSMLGIESMECNCSQTYLIEEEEAYWTFQGEPKITKVSGPAEGKLKRGDRIVAIDGLLITTRKGGLRFSEVEPGDRVELKVRRSGRTLSVTIDAEDPPEEKEVDVSDTDAWVIAPSLVEALESLAERSEELSSLVEVVESDLMDDVYSAVRGISPDGWFGVGLSFSGSVKAGDGDDSPRWEFDSPPEVHAVKSSSPADRAGLRKGDVLTHIDGVRLTSKEGGRRFGAVEPGQTVEFSVRRGGETLAVEITAEEQP